MVWHGEAHVTKTTRSIMAFSFVGVGFVVDLAVKDRR